MCFKNLLLGILVITAVSFAEAVDTTSNKGQPATKTTITSSVMAGIESSNSLKKQKKVYKPPTTWSKIKDLFM